MRTVVVFIAFLTVATCARAEDVLKKIAWDSLREAERPAGSEIVKPGAANGSFALRIANPQAKAVSITVLTLDKPGITNATYAVRGKVRYTQVQGVGYLEMWNYFPGNAAYFSRTMGDVGPMQKLTGSSEWRPFVLPFFLKDAPERPDKLVLNVVLPGSGTVELGPLELVQFAAQEDPLKVR